MGRSTSDRPEPVHPPPVAEEIPEDVGLDPRRHGDAEILSVRQR